MQSCPDFQTQILDAVCGLPLAPNFTTYKGQVEDLIEATVTSPVCDDGQPGAGSETNCEDYLKLLILNQSACQAIQLLLP